MSGFDNDIMYSNNADFSTAGSGGGSESNGLITNGQLWIGRTAVNAGGTHIDVNTITAGTGIAISNGPGTITVSNTGSITDLHVARYIVSAGGTSDGANYTTIASAITAATLAGGSQTIFIQPGTYTENLTMVANINLAAFSCDALAETVTINGKITANYTGKAGISGINLKTNGDYAISVSSANSELYITNCNFRISGSPGIQVTSGILRVYNSVANNSTTDALGSFTGGTASFINCPLSTNANATASAVSGGVFVFLQCNMNGYSFTTSGSATLSFVGGGLALFAGTITIGDSSGTSGASAWTGSSSSAVLSVSVGSTFTLERSVISSSAVNTLTGAGILKYAIISFTGTSSGVNTTTLTPLATLI